MTKVSLHRFARLPQRFLLALGLGLGILTVGAIAPPPSLTEEAKPSTAIAVTPAFTTLPNQLVAIDALWLAAPAALPDFLRVSLYTPAESCDTYQSAAQVVVADQAIAQVVQTLVTQQTPLLLDFELAGYRVLPGDRGTSVTIDFRRHPEAQRHFISLSICEQRLLLGSLRETLLRNPALGVSAVKFTEQGRSLL